MFIVTSDNTETKYNSQINGLSQNFINPQTHNKHVVNIQLGGDPAATMFAKINQPDSGATSGGG